MNELYEAFLAAIVAKLSGGKAELTADDLLAVEGKMLRIEDTDAGFMVVIEDGE